MIYCVCVVEGEIDEFQLGVCNILIAADTSAILKCKTEHPGQAAAGRTAPLPSSPSKVHFPYLKEQPGYHLNINNAMEKQVCVCVFYFRNY